MTDFVAILPLLLLVLLIFSTNHATTHTQISHRIVASAPKITVKFRFQSRHLYQLQKFDTLLLNIQFITKNQIKQAPKCHFSTGFSGRIIGAPFTFHLCQKLKNRRNRRADFLAIDKLSTQIIYVISRLAVS